MFGKLLTIIKSFIGFYMTANKDVIASHPSNNQCSHLKIVPFASAQ